MPTWTEALTEADRRTIMTALDQRGHQYLQHADNDRPFAAFLLALDSAAHRTLGVSILDLPDFRWRDPYEDGMSPAEALTEAGNTGAL